MKELKSKKPQWLGKLKPYEAISLTKGIFQIIITTGAFFGLLAAMFYMASSNVPYWAILALSVLAGGFYTRIFIIFHDCCHYSFFKSRTACTVAGHVFGTMVFTSYYDWQKSHNYHHSTSGNLDKRGTGDVWTMTVEEYKNSDFLTKIRYRIMRNPVFLFGIVPVLLFLILNRFPTKNSGRKEVISVIGTDILVALVFIIAYYTIGLLPFLKVMAPVFIFGSTFGVWLFYIQHQFRDVYWARSGEWDYFRAAMEGSSHYKLHPVLRWLSGNIGYHHIHHLRPKVPNYNLKNCYDNIRELRDVSPVTLFQSFQSLGLRLWDEKNKQLVSFSSLSR